MRARHLAVLVGALLLCASLASAQAVITPFTGQTVTDILALHGLGTRFAG